MPFARGLQLPELPASRPLRYSSEAITLELVGAEARALGGATGEAWGVLDVGRGRWPYRTQRSCAGAAGRSSDGRVVSLQRGGKWTDGTGFTEKNTIVDGHLNELGEDLTWEYSWEEPMRPWRATAPGGALHLTLRLCFDRHARTNTGALATEVPQMFGAWAGSSRTDAGEVVTIEGLQGLAEESGSRW
ncbi:MAG: DUF2804 family protein [Actinobacteria bacterium]|nr:DUF2804 family protein [Actinomycetota bacterium]